MTSPMKCGLMLPTHAPRETAFDASCIGSTAEWAEAVGFDAVWAGDHIVHPWHFMEALTSLTFAAARTRTTATLATLSNGRLRLGIGIGGEWPKEWQAAGVPLKERGARLEEALPLLRRIYAGEAVDAEGRFNSFSGVSVSPLPPPIPVYLAGKAEAALDRIGRLADGWLGFFVTPKGFQRSSAAIDEARERAGRIGQPFERGLLLHFLLDDSHAAVTKALELNFGFPRDLKLAANVEQLKQLALVGSADDVLARLQQFIDVGCTTFCVSPMEKETEAYRRQVERFAAEVLPRLKTGTLR